MPKFQIYFATFRQRNKVIFSVTALLGQKKRSYLIGFLRRPSFTLLFRLWRNKGRRKGSKLNQNWVKNEKH